MNVGKKFESQFKKSLLKDNFYVVRIPDPPQSFNQSDKQLRFSNKNPFDLIAFKNKTLYCLELKSNNSTSFSIQTNKDEKGKNIKLHQIEGLKEASEYEGVIAGFILNFRKINKTYFIDINNFLEYFNNTSKKSINEDDIKTHRGILIPQKLIRVNFTYDFMNIVNFYKRKGVEN